MSGKVWDCLISSWTTTHLGINPVKGGKPPKESRAKNLVKSKIGLLKNINCDNIKQFWLLNKITTDLEIKV